MKLDYSPLQESVSVTDTTDYLRWHESQKTRFSIRHNELPARYLGAGSLFAGIVGIVMLASAMPAGSWRLVVLFIIAPMISLLLLLLWPILRSIPKDTPSESVVKYKFAKRNNLLYRENVIEPNHRGVIFERGHRRRLEDAYYFPDGMVIGNYSYLEPHGRAGDVRRTWHFASVPLPKYLPHMLLNSCNRSIFNATLHIPEDLEGQTLSLEGDFNKYFTLYVARRHAQDALYVFTPDVMGSLIDLAHSYDVEIIDNKLLLYRDGYIGLGDVTEIQQLLAVIGAIKSEVNHQARRHT